VFSGGLVARTAAVALGCLLLLDLIEKLIAGHRFQQPNQLGSSSNWPAAARRKKLAKTD